MVAYKGHVTAILTHTILIIGVNTRCKDHFGTAHATETVVTHFTVIDTSRTTDHIAHTNGMGRKIGFGTAHALVPMSHIIIYPNTILENMLRLTGLLNFYIFINQAIIGHGSRIDDFDVGSTLAFDNISDNQRTHDLHMRIIVSTGQNQIRARMIARPSPVDRILMAQHLYEGIIISVVTVFTRMANIATGFTSCENNRISEHMHELGQRLTAVTSTIPTGIQELSNRLASSLYEISLLPNMTRSIEFHGIGMVAILAGVEYNTVLVTGCRCNGLHIAMACRLVRNLFFRNVATTANAENITIGQASALDLGFRPNMAIQLTTLYRGQLRNGVIGEMIRLESHIAVPITSHKVGSFDGLQSCLTNKPNVDTIDVLPCIDRIGDGYRYKAVTEIGNIAAIQCKVVNGGILTQLSNFLIADGQISFGNLILQVIFVQRIGTNGDLIAQFILRGIIQSTQFDGGVLQLNLARCRGILIQSSLRLSRIIDHRFCFQTSVVTAMVCLDLIGFGTAIIQHPSMSCCVGQNNLRIEMTTPIAASLTLNSVFHTSGLFFDARRIDMMLDHITLNTLTAGATGIDLDIDARLIGHELLNRCYPLNVMTKGRPLLFGVFIEAICTTVQDRLSLFAIRCDLGNHFVIMP